MHAETTKRVLTLLILIAVVGVSVFVPLTVVQAQGGTGAVVNFATNAVTGGAGVVEALTNLPIHGLNWTAFGLLSISSALLNISGLILNAAIEFTVLGFADLVDNISAIQIGWEVLRDVANIIIIFVLLLLGIGTIINLDTYNARTLLTKVVIAALLINFSMFFARVVIDASNLLATTLHNPIAAVETAAGGSATGGITAGGQAIDSVQSAGFSGVFQNAFQLQTIFKNVGGFDEFDTLLFQVLGALFILIAAFVFFAAALMLVVRFVVLVFVLMAAPVGFVGGLLPGLKRISGQWWGALINQALFPPIFFLLSLIAFAVITDPRFVETFQGGTGFAAAFDGGSVMIILNFAIAIGLLIAALMAAKHFATTGSHGFLKVVNKAAGNVVFGGAGRLGRQTLGRIGLAASRSEGLQRLAAQTGAGGVAGRLALRTTGAAATASFDARGVAGAKNLGFGTAKTGGIKKESEAAVKRKTEQIKAVGGATRQTRQAVAIARDEVATSARALSAQEAATARDRKQKLDEAEKAFKDGNLSETQVQQARSAFSSLSREQRAYGEAITRLSVAEKKAGGEERASRLQYAERRVGTGREGLFGIPGTNIFGGIPIPRTATTREAARKVRGELTKNKNKKLLEDIKNLAKESGGGEEKPKEEGGAPESGEKKEGGGE